MTKGGSRFWVLDIRKRGKEKNFWTDDNGNRTGEEIGVPTSYSRIPEFSGSEDTVN